MSDRTLPTLRCIEFVDYVTEWEHGALSDEIRAEVEEHLALCPDCVDYVHQLRATVGMLRGLLDEAPPPAARDAALEVFRVHRRGEPLARVKRPTNPPDAKRRSPACRRLATPPRTP